MKKIISVLFLILGFNAFGQRYTDSISIKDFNTDGIVDTLNYFKEYGSSFGGVSYKIIDGKTNETYELSNFSSYGSTKKLIPIPSKLLEKGYESFLEIIKKELLPQEKRNEPDTSLQWIINATFNSHKVNDSSYFDKVFTPDTKWVISPYEPPSTYYIEVQVDSLLKLADSYTAVDTDYMRTKNQRAFLLYSGKAIRDWDLKVDDMGNSEDGLIPVVSNKTYKIYKSKHGILAKKASTHKWLFITDGDITNAPQKLRWASIDKIILKDDYLIFKQNLAPDPAYDVFVIHIESGAFGRLNIDFDELLKEEIFINDLSDEESLSIKNDTLSIGRDNLSLHLPFYEIKKNLNSFSKGE